jgi:hypothetical protein
MMKKLIVLVMALAIAVPALADDFSPAPFRYDPGSTYMEWTYDADAPYSGYNDRWDIPDTHSFVTHPLKEDPADWQGDWEEWGYEFINGTPYDPCVPDTSYAGVFGLQMWAMGSGMEETPGDPCSWVDTAPIWIPTLAGRTGVMADMAMVSWDLNNFVHDQPAKDIQMQITYFNLDAPGTPIEYEYIGAGTVTDNIDVIHEYGDPCFVPSEWGNFEGLLSDFGPPIEEGDGWWETWMGEDPCDPCTFGQEICYWEGPLEELDPCLHADPAETWFQGETEVWFEGEVTSTVIDGGWIQDLVTLTMPMNPSFEWIEFGAGEGALAIDQIIIETLCYVPEPTTMVLLGLGSLLMIRRRR